MTILEVWRGGEDTAARLREDATLIDPFARTALHEPTFDFSSEAAKPWSRLWVARPQQRASPIGFLVSWHVADELHVLSVAVVESARRRGIGRALMEAALDYSRANAVRLVLLEVRRTNRAAIRLYRSLSFSAMGVRPKYYADTGEDAVEMALSLDPITGQIVLTKDETLIEV
ncbi:MAG: ribosomal protein S18-alanine N-acetyltransferase [Polyangiaceae bacterium]